QANCPVEIGRYRSSLVGRQQPEGAMFMIPAQLPATFTGWVEPWLPKDSFSKFAATGGPATDLAQCFPSPFATKVQSRGSIARPRQRAARTVGESQVSSLNRPPDGIKAIGDIPRLQHIVDLTQGPLVAILLNQDWQTKWIVTVLITDLLILGADQKTG